MTIELSEYVINAIADAVVKKMQEPSYNSIKTELEPCDDAISRQDLREPRFIIAENDYQKGWNDALDSVYENAPSVQPQQKNDIEYSGWIPITSRPMTEEEKEHYKIHPDYLDECGIFNCELPDDGQEVLISVCGGVEVDTFAKDGNDGCYFEGRDIDDVDAWMPLPEAYKAKGEELKPKRRMYKGCENCKNYQNRICMMTGEELAMVCEEWEAKDEQG